MNENDDYREIKLKNAEKCVYINVNVNVNVNVSNYRLSVPIYSLSLQLSSTVVNGFSDNHGVLAESYS